MLPNNAARTFWQIMNLDHGRLLRNIVRWALGEEPVVAVEGPGLIDVTAWRQERSMTVHLVNLTNPMMMKGPFRELLPVDAQQLSIEIPRGADVTGVQKARPVLAHPRRSRRRSCWCSASRPWQP